MDKMKMETVDGIARNIEKLEELFPNCVTETRGAGGALKKAINFDVLRQLLSGEIADDSESYDFTWVGKKDALAEAYKPIRKTLRPCPEESRDWDSTQNLYIEGDNLEVLKLLQESYLGKVKVIYIDPPYNTGNDFIYNDNFRADDEEYDEDADLYDEDGNSLFKENGATNPRFHSAWCSMIYSRLLLARALLSDDGVIFISIDDNEVDNLRKIGGEVFGLSNFIGMILWKKKTNGNNMGFIPSVHDYIAVYCKNISEISEIGYDITAEHINKVYSNPDNDPRGLWTTMDLSANHKGPSFPIKNPNTGEIFTPPEGRYWVFNEEEVQKRIEDGRIIFGRTGTTRPVQKVFATERMKGKIRTESWWDNKGMNEDATAEMRDLFGQGKIFTHPKPSKLLYNLIKIVTSNRDSIILDFFSGSATTAHAVMQLNAERFANDSRQKKNVGLHYIMVQLPEVCDAKSEAFKSGYKNICEIGKERIRRAGDKIKSENPLTTEGLDFGFRVFKVDSSNMNDVYYGCYDLTQDMIASMESNIKPDRSDLDLLFSCVLEWGLPLSLPYKIERIEGFSVHNYNAGDLLACFEEGLSEKAVIAIARRNPLRVVFRDSCFKDVASKVNLSEIFKRFAPDAKIKTL